MRLDDGQIKRASRLKIYHDAMLVDSSGRQYAVTVLDISTTGFRAQCDETLKIGEYVALRVPRYGDFQAQIRWSVGDEAGGMFLNPVVLPDEDCSA